MGDGFKHCGRCFVGDNMPSSQLNMADLIKDPSFIEINGHKVYVTAITYSVQAGDITRCDISFVMPFESDKKDKKQPLSKEEYVFEESVVSSE